MIVNIAETVKNLFFICGIIILIAITICFIAGLKPVVVMSGSMEPEISTGSILLINEKDKEISEGDIIAFDRQGMAVVHRVVEISQQGIITKGDNNESEDPGKVLTEDIKGTVCLCIPAAGYVVNRMCSVQGIAVIAVMVLILIAVDYFAGRGGEDDSTKALCPKKL